jgi:hypothetical protein
MMTTTTPMLIYRGKLVSGPAALPRLMLRELTCETVHAGHASTPRGDEEWHRLSPFERFEWLEEHCWILPPEERWDAMKRSRAKIVAALKNRAWDLACRRMAPGHA